MSTHWVGLPFHLPVTGSKKGDTHFKTLLQVYVHIICHDKEG